MTIKSKHKNIDLMELKDHSPYLVTICSGKGGVGKSVLSANLSHKFAEKGLKTLIWDADSQFPNQHLLFGVEPPVRLSQVYSNKVPVKTAIYNIRRNLDLLADMPASGLAEEYSKNSVLNVYNDLLLDTNYDIIIVDAPAGATEQVLNCCNISNHIAVVITDEPTSLLDGYGLIKILLNFLDKEKISLLVNNVIDVEDADEISEKLNKATHKFLKVEFEKIGFVPYDRVVRQSIIRQSLFVNNECPLELMNAIEIITENIIKKF